MSKRLQELEKKYKELGEEIERLKNEGKVWKPKNGELYYHLTGSANFDNDTWNEHPVDKSRDSIGNCFKTEKEAISVLEKIKIYTELKRLAEEINTVPIDWENRNQNKYYIEYNNFAKELNYGCVGYTKYIGTIHSTNSNFLKIAKERIGEDRLLKLFKE